MRRRSKCVCMWVHRGVWVEEGSCWLWGQESDVTAGLVFDRKDFLSAGCLPGALCVGGVSGGSDQHLTPGNDNPVQATWSPVNDAQYYKSNQSVLSVLLSFPLILSSFHCSEIVSVKEENTRSPISPCCTPVSALWYQQQFNLSLSIGRGPPRTQTQSCLPPALTLHAPGLVLWGQR